MLQGQDRKKIRWMAQSRVPRLFPTENIANALPVTPSMLRFFTERKYELTYVVKHVDLVAQKHEKDNTRGAQVMVCRIHSSAFIAACLIAALPGSKPYAADSRSTLIAANSARTSGQLQRSAGQKPVRKGRPAPKKKKDQAPLATSTNPQNIHTYSALEDRLYRFDPRVIGRTSFSPPSAVRPLGTGIGQTLSGGTPSIPLKQSPGAPAGIGFREESASATGIVFDCRTRPYPPSMPREVTACYVHKVDKAWKTHTFVSRGLPDGNSGTSGWGGGVAVGYAY